MIVAQAFKYFVASSSMMPMELIQGADIVGASPALYLRRYRALIIADIHIGYEDELASKGVFIPRFQLKRAIELVDGLLSELAVDELVIAGDLKHSFNGLSPLERRELVNFLEYVTPKVKEVIVVRGNHDNYLPILKRRLDFRLEEFLMIGEYLVVHGHKRLPKDTGYEWSYLVLGHEHPSITLRDSVGRLGKFHCFLVGELKSSGKTFITLPATGAYQTGSRITLNPDTFISPILRDEALIQGIRPVIIDDDVGVFELPSLSELAEYIS